MEFTLSKHAIDAMQERGILREWVAVTMDNPEKIEPHRDDRALMHALRRIPDFGNRVLRVIYNRANEPPHVVTVYFDRTPRGRL